MLLNFSNAAELSHAFQVSMLWGALVVVITTVLMTLSLEGTKSEISRSTGAILGCLFYLLFGVLNYQERYSGFTEAEFSNQTITLRFAGSYFKPLELQSDSIVDIKVGHPGKGEPVQCYLDIETASGAHHRSAPSADIDCDAYRQQVMRYLTR